MGCLPTTENYIYGRQVGLHANVIKRLGGAAYLKSLDEDARKVLLNDARDAKTWKGHGIKPRKSLRRGEPTSEEKQAARVHARTRANGRCQLRIAKDCTQEKVLPLNGDVMVRGHLVHGHAKRRYGWHESEVTGQYHLWGCFACHNYEHAGRKPCKAK